jgi:DNA-binding NarL/FixJ family response regulator
MQATNILAWIGSNGRQPAAGGSLERHSSEQVDLHLRRMAEVERCLDRALALARSSVEQFEHALCLLAQVEPRGTAPDGGAVPAQLDSIPARGAPRAPRAMRTPAGGPVRLTRRELDVLRLLAAGKSNRAIGAELFLSVRTVERHIANLYRKIDARNRADATAWAIRHAST